MSFQSFTYMKRKVLSISLGLIVVIVFSCQPKDNLQTGEGYINVRGGKMWYQVCGEGNEIPIVMLHGGPGSPSYYLNPLLALSNDRPVIVYDQLGCGRSDRITDTSLMTIENNIDHLHQLLKTLKIKDFYLYGHSWGTMLGLDYYLKYPRGIKALILASPCISIKLWSQDADTLISMLPDSIQFYLKQKISNTDIDSTKIKEALDCYYGNYYTRKQPVSEDIDSMISQFGENLYKYMWGMEEYSATGILKDYDRTIDLDKVKIPTLYIAGEYDAARPNTVRYYQSITPNSKLVIIKNSGHMTMQDNSKENIEAIKAFIDQIETN